jgi:APA family basic amino acid/polyamine antiporter
MVVYLSLNLLLIYATPLEKMKNEVAIGSIAATNLFGPRVGGVFAALMALSLTSAVNAMVIIGPRVYYAMAHNRAFFRAAGEVHPRWRTPVNSILMQGICSILMTLTPFPSLIVYIGFSLTFFTVMAVGSVFIFRRQGNWQQLGALNFLYPLIPGAYILIGVATIIWGVIWAPGPSIAALATIAVGAAVYRSTTRSAGTQ